MSKHSDQAIEAMAKPDLKLIVEMLRIMGTEGKWWAAEKGIGRIDIANLAEKLNLIHTGLAAERAEMAERQRAVVPDGLTDGVLDNAAAQAMDRVGALYGLRAIEINHDVVVHAALRRALVMAGVMLAASPTPPAPNVEGKV